MIFSLSTRIMKTYVITLSKCFMSGHPRKGEETFFAGLFLNGDKIHTLRSGDYWKKVVEKVNSGDAILSVRQWAGKPYNSKQNEIGERNKLGYQDIEITEGLSTYIDGKLRSDYDLSFLTEIAINDGLFMGDFLDWFELRSKKPKSFKGGIIHFTDFRY